MSGEDMEARGRQIRAEMAVGPMIEPTEFRAPFEEMITRYCFGEVWGRELLPRKIRSMLTIAILAGASRPSLVQVHVKAAIKNGVTKEEIREVLMHAAIYSGVPAAVDSFRQAEIALGEMGLL